MSVVGGGGRSVDIVIGLVHRWLVWRWRDTERKCTTLSNLIYEMEIHCCGSGSSYNSYHIMHPYYSTPQLVRRNNKRGVRWHEALPRQWMTWDWVKFKWYLADLQNNILPKRARWRRRLVLVVSLHCHDIGWWWSIPSPPPSHLHHINRH